MRIGIQDNNGNMERNTQEKRYLNEKQITQKEEQLRIGQNSQDVKRYIKERRIKLRDKRRNGKERAR